MDNSSDARSGPEPVNPMCPVVHRVVSNIRETDDIFTLTLAADDRKGGGMFLPGQFNMLYTFGIGESAISISGSPCDNAVTMHTIRRVGMVTKALGSLRAGDRLGVRGPFGNPWPMEQTQGRDLLVIAGGIGLAPLRPVIEYVLANRAACERLTVLTGARDRNGILYGDQLQAWKTLPRVDTKVTVDHADSQWKGNVGVVTTLVKRVVFDPLNTIAFVCGPEIMMRYAVVELRKYGVADDQIYLSLERNMKCAIGFCGHCQYGSEFICRDGPVFRYDRVAFWLNQREL